ncbi:MAG: hypothetical protein KGI29_05555 [Pseudomonadota bacterium]|nr:hypothetical protein [Pseudomonadota bacterium]
MTITMHTQKQRTIVEQDGTIRVTVPISFVRKGGRKYILAPEGSPSPFQPVRINEVLVKGIARAFQLKEEVESGKMESFRDIGRSNDQSHSYLLRLYRLTALAPDIVQAILNGRQPKTLALQDMLKQMPAHWPEQRRLFGFPQI